MTYVFDTVSLDLTAPIADSFRGGLIRGEGAYWMIYSTVYLSRLTEQSIVVNSCMSDSTMLNCYTFTLQAASNLPFPVRRAIFQKATLHVSEPAKKSSMLYLLEHSNRCSANQWKPVVAECGNRCTGYQEMHGWVGIVKA